MLGNAAFVASARRDPRSSATRGCRRRWPGAAPYYLQCAAARLRHRAAPAAIVYPTIARRRPLELDLGDRVLLLQAWPTAHTDNDLTVLDRATRTLFAGDLLFVRHLPALDGKLLGWLAVMDRLALLPVRLAVPGHGAPSTDWPGVMAPQRAYLERLRDGVRAAIRRDQSLSQTVNQLGEQGIEGWQLTDRFHRRNVTAAFAELEWTD